ncbi:MAG: hypothetical protein IJ864_00235 [Alphaproteobacteria bacterium]|nr:hypothetical protein [Alphaproteobacteria bacterium]
MVNTRSFLVPFRYSHKVAYIIEFSSHLIRFYARDNADPDMESVVSADNSELVITTAGVSSQTIQENIVWTPSVQSDVQPDGGSLIERDNLILNLDSPYSFEDLWDDEELCFKLQTIQNADVLYIFSEKHPIKVLKRYSRTDWRLEDLEIVNGPFEAMNSTDISLQADGVNGVVTIAADGDVFTDSDVGRLVRLRGYDGNIKIWSAGISVSNGEIVASDNKYFQAQNSGTTGTKKPVHGEGIRSDGGVRWLYLHDGSGIVKITAVNSARGVQAEVLKRLPDAVCEGTVYWELGLLHTGVNYPKSGAFFRNRFAFLINTDTGPKVCLSVVGDYNNFADMSYGETTAESAITVPVLNTEFNEGKWLYAGEVLFVGTGAAEFYIDTLSSANALANDNVKIVQISNVGSKALMPVAVGSHVFFADRYGLSLRDLSYNYYKDGYDQVDVSLLGKHLFAARIVALSYQEVPNKILWCLIGDGTLAALTFSAEQEVSALSRHDFSGIVESIAVVPNFNACCDELWLEVRRTINQQTMRTIEFMENGMPIKLPMRVYMAETLNERQKLENEYILHQSRYLDGAVLFVRDEGDTRTEISGLEHLEGEMVQIFANGAVCTPQMVINGTIQIEKTDTMVLVGKAVVSQYIPQAIYIDDNNGSGIGQKQRISHVELMMYLSGGGQIGEDETRLSNILYRHTDAIMNQPQALFSGCQKILFNGSTDTQYNPAQIVIENRSPLPMNILAIVPEIN